MTYPEDLEAPEVDAVEQATNADPREEIPDEPRAWDDEVPEWDAREQSQEVQLEDDYR
jgi:hypothetical protein